MSKKTQNQLAEGDKKSEYENRKDTMLAEMQKISEKYRIDLVPIIQATPQGILPMIAFVDVKDKYEARAAEEAQKPKKKLEV